MTKGCLSLLLTVIVGLAVVNQLWLVPLNTVDDQQPLFTNTISAVDGTATAVSAIATYGYIRTLQSSVDYDIFRTSPTPSPTRTLIRPAGPETVTANAVQVTLDYMHTVERSLGIVRATPTPRP